MSDQFASPVKPLIDTRPDAFGGRPHLPSLGLTNPNDPPWGVSQALLIWVISIALLFIVPLLAILPYVLYRVLFYGSVEGLGTDANLIFISIISVLPAHVLTFLTVWFLVTNKGRRSFWETLGWSWPENFGLGKTIGLAVGLFVLGGLITWLFGGSETQLDQIINSSLKARFATAFLAAATGPLVEELIYRGVLYSALQRALGMVWAVVVVSILFAGVHVLQYYKNLGVIAVIVILSVSLTLVRAFTGSLLPSFVMHLIFNGIQALYLVLQPFVGKPAVEKKAAVSFIIHNLSRLIS